MLYHQATTNQAQIDESKTICLLGYFLFFVFFAFFEEIEFTANAKVLMQVSPSLAAMQKFHAFCIHSRFLVPRFYISS